ncbi:MAG: YjjW family glycine radical enzyme activase [Lachnospiraceae bacterium]|nr:YjjW family glycine radical enzyme activase [Lachnospiraceae bacterium]
MKAVVNRIIPFSSVDGPGNRTAIFLQGCNINCKYCHNPETRGLCIGCGSCVEQCPVGALSRTAEGRIRYDASKCVQCDTCIHVCPHDSSPRTWEMSPEEAYEKVKRQIPFIRGITVSGGECMLQPDFLLELFRLAGKDGLTTMIDSNGTIPFWEFPELLSVTDGVMLDIKAFGAKEHQRITEASNDTVLKNAVYLAEQSKLYEVRCVIVPDLYDAEQSIRDMGKFLAPYLKIREFRIKIIAYRPMGVREAYSHYRIPGREYLDSLADILREYGFRDIVMI